MVLRDITVMYKQSILGFAWALINPAISMVIFSIVFGKLANISSESIPYPIFSFVGLIPWTYFSTTLSASSNSLIVSSSIFTKVYFPRLIIPLTPVFSKLLDFFISFVLLFSMMIYYGYYPQFKILILPFLIIVMVITTTGLGAFFSSLALYFRDIRFAITFLMPLLMYIAPVVFPAALIQQKFGHTAYMLYGLYPMTGVIEGFRAAIIPSKIIPWDLIIMSSIGAVLILIFGIITFKKLENKFADVA